MQIMQFGWLYTTIRYTQYTPQHQNYVALASLTHSLTLTHTLSLCLYIYKTQVSKEGDQFPVPLSVANMSELVKSLVEEDESDEVNEIPLPNVKSNVLQKVIEFCEHHAQEPMTEIEKPLKSQNMADVVQQWYADYVNVEQVLLFELILAANYMDIKPLLDLTCASVASMIKGKTPEEIRQTFNISNDFSPEEEMQVREENKWCEEAWESETERVRLDIKYVWS